MDRNSLYVSENRVYFRKKGINYNLMMIGYIPIGRASLKPMKAKEEKKQERNWIA